MIPFEEVDERLKRIGKDRVWLANASGRSLASVAAGLAPNAPIRKRSKLLQKSISDAIIAEEQRQRLTEEQKRTPGYSDIFLTDEQLNLADRASRIVGSPSLADFCRTAILQEARRILTEEAAKPDGRKTA